MLKKICIPDFFEYFLTCIIGLIAQNVQAQSLDYAHEGTRGAIRGLWGLGISGWITLIFAVAVVSLMAIWLFKRRKK